MAATQLVGTMSDPTVAGRGADAPGPLGYAEEGDAMNAYASPAASDRAQSATPMP
ncbi:hypothetical protein [Tardiphaga sp. vice304]|uniref:hypothetical protein n=1 Tax=Tardiphaga sp. vice304 TaxID=2592817 RepID=UPI001FEE239C|nr:hypothetical protein [Tardiphaga sp. vice304]